MEMVEVLAHGPGVAVTASVTKVFGPCLLGLMPGNTWRIGPDGSLSRPMCRPGATALSGLFQMANGDAMGRSAGCDCVIAGREGDFYCAGARVGARAGNNPNPGQSMAGARHAPAISVSRRCLWANRRTATNAHNPSITVMG